MLINDENHVKIYYCPWSKRYVEFTENILWHEDVPSDITTLEDYITRSAVVGGSFIDV